MSSDQLRSMLGPRWTGAKRFGVPQGGKVRLVDDFTEMGQNSTVGLEEKLVLSGIDEVVAIARLWHRGRSRTSPSS